LRFWQDCAVELDDDSYGSYNFNWGYYLESLRLFCTTGIGKPFQSPVPSKTAEIIVLATIKAQSGKQTDLEQALRDVVTPTRAQPGCLQFELYRSAQDPAMMTAFEHWISSETHDHHLQGEHVKTLMKRFDGVVATPPEFVFLKPL
jgi:quinol monooxygenase YgiN